MIWDIVVVIVLMIVIGMLQVKIRRDRRPFR